MTREIMLRRIEGVLLNYVTRPMVWVLFGIYAVSLSGVLFFSIRTIGTEQSFPRQQAYPEGTCSGGTLSLINGEPDSQRQSVLNFGHDRFDVRVTNVNIRWSVLFNLLMTSQSDTREDTAAKSVLASRLLQQLRKCRNLKSLTLQSRLEIGEEEAAAIGDLHQLQSLSLIQCGIRPSLWKQLGRLPNLRYLDLSGCDLHGDYPDLESLAHVETLILGSPGMMITENDVPFTPELRRLPRLKTIVLGSHYYSVSEMQRTRRVAEVLQQAPPVPLASDPLVGNMDYLRAIITLRTLFVFDAGRDFNKLQDAFPGVQVKPSFVDVGRQYAINVMLFLNFLMMFFLGQQIHSQFSQPSAHLTPNYTAPHMIPLVFIWVFGLVMHTVPIVAMGVSFFTAIGLNLLFWSIMLGFALVDTLMRGQNGRIRSALLLTVMTATFWVPIAVFLLQQNRSSLDWHLRGQEPGRSILFIICGVVTSIGALRRSTRLYSMFLERGELSPPISMNPAAVEVWRQHAAWSRSPGWMTWLANDWRDRAIAEASRPGWRSRSNLWLAGNCWQSHQYWIFGMFMTAIMAMIGAGDKIDWAAGFPSFQYEGVLMCSLFLADLPFAFLIGPWRARLTMLGVESLRPNSRKQFARQIATAVAWNMTPLAFVYLTVLTWYTVEADPTRWSWAWTLAMLQVFAARWLVLYGLMLWGISIRDNWVALLSGALSGYLILIANLLITFLQAPMLQVSSLPSDMPDIGVLPLFGMASIYSLVACAVIKFGYQRWQRIELA